MRRVRETHYLRTTRGGMHRFLAAATALSMLVSIAAPAAGEDMIQMEAYPPPANSVAKQAEQIRSEQQAAASEKSSQPAASSGAAVKQTPGGKKAIKHYPGLFDMFSAVSEYVPLKSGMVRGSLITLAQTPGGAQHIDTRNFTGGYFFETEDMSYGVLKNTSGKVQFNRQIKNSLNSNFMNEWTSNIFGTAVKFSRNVVRTGGAGSQNAQDTRRLSFDYKTKKKISISYITDMVGSRTISAAPTRTTNKKQAWTVTAPILKDKAKLSAVHSLTANRNYSSGAVTKALLSEVKLDVPFSKNLELNLGYQFAGNSSMGGAAAGQTTRKSTRTVGLSYILAPETKVSLLLNSISTRNYAAAFSTNSARKLDLKFEHGLSERAKFRSSFASNNDGISGRTKLRNDTLSYDHKNVKYLSGTTTVESRRQVQSGLNSTANDTFSVTTPLNYFNNRLNVNLQHTGTSQKSLTSHQDVTAKNNTVAADYKITKSFTAGTSLNNVRNATYLLDAITATTNSRTHTYKGELTVRRLFGSVVPSLENFKYSYSLSNAATSNLIPATVGNLNRIRKHALLFLFKENLWNGKYSFERAFSSSGAGQTQRALIHKVEWSFTDFLGCELTTNYTGAFQKTGLQSSGLFKLTKKIKEKESVYATFEFLRNKDRQTAANNSRNRYFEVGYEASF